MRPSVAWKILLTKLRLSLRGLMKATRQHDAEHSEERSPSLEAFGAQKAAQALRMHGGLLAAGA